MGHFLLEMLHGFLIGGVCLALFALTFRIRNESVRALCSLAVVFGMGWFHLIGVLLGIIGVMMISAGVFGTRKDRRARKVHRSSASTAFGPNVIRADGSKVAGAGFRPNPNYPIRPRKETR